MWGRFSVLSEGRFTSRWLLKCREGQVTLTQDEKSGGIENKAVLVGEEKLVYPASEGRPKSMPSQRADYVILLSLTPRPLRRDYPSLVLRRSVLASHLQFLLSCCPQKHLEVLFLEIQETHK